MRSGLAPLVIMPNRPRGFVPGVSLHVRQRGNNRCAVFGDDEDYESYLLMLRSASARYEVAVHGFSLMTTHTHLQITPSTEVGASAVMKELGVRYVLYFNRRYQRVGTLWTGRFRAKPIDDERYWITCLRYIEQNPVRANIVVQADQYRWSSYRAHAFGDAVEWLASHPALDALGSNPDQRQAAYRSICAVPLNTAELVRQRFDDPALTRVRPRSDPGQTPSPSQGDPASLAAAGLIRRSRSRN
jgi:REP-associated tyrosine transposase